MFLLFHIGSDLILSMAGSLFLLVSVVAFVYGLVVFWVYGGVQCTMHAYNGCKNIFAICNQTVFLSLSNFAVHFVRIFVVVVVVVGFQY